MEFSGETRPSSERSEMATSPERATRRAGRLSEHIDGIERAQQDFFVKQGFRNESARGAAAEPIRFGGQAFMRGVNAALFAFMGASAASWSFIKRGEYGFWGHSIAAGGIFFGMQLFGHKG